MMTKMKNRGRLLASLTFLGAMLFGCNPPHNERLNSPPQGASNRVHELNEQYVYMADNALLEDMTMSSVHFVTNQAELNSLGARRLNRYASIMEVYGGTLRYDGTEPNKKLRADRVARIKDYLVNAGIAPNRFDVGEGLASSSGMAGDEALKIRIATRLKPSGEISSDGGSMAFSGGGSGSGGK